MSKLEMIGRWVLAMLAAALAFNAVLVLVPIILAVLAIVLVAAHLSHTVSVPQIVAEGLMWGFGFGSAAAIIVGSTVVPPQHHLVARKIFSALVMIVSIGSVAFVRVKAKWFAPADIIGSLGGVIFASGYYRWQQWLKTRTLY